MNLQFGRQQTIDQGLAGEWMYNSISVDHGRKFLTILAYLFIDSG